MATVKGDVHDIGKNIVGVVLGCNGYEVIDLGVMVPATKILETAREREGRPDRAVRAITPSLDEMRAVAPRWSGRASTTPLLIGGATTSRAHTAVQASSPAYSAPVVHVLDASRAVGVAAALLDPARATRSSRRRSAEYDALRAAARRTATSRTRRLTHRRGAREPAGASTGRPRPRRGRRSWACGRSSDCPLAELVERIDWTPFFPTWELPRRVSRDPRRPERVGKAARDLLEDAQKLLERIVDERLLRRTASSGFWPAAHDRRRRHPCCTPTSRGRRAARDLTPCASRWPSATAGRTSRWPTSRRPSDSGVADYVGAFAVTTGLGLEELARRVRRGARRLLARSCSRRSPTGWPRRSPSGSTSGSGASCGATRRTRRSTTTTLIARALPGHPARARLPRLPGPHREAHAVPAARRRGARGHPLTEIDGDGARARRSAASTSGTREAQLLRPRPDRPRPARGLRAPQGLVDRRGRAMARPEPQRRRHPTRGGAGVRRLSLAPRRPRPPGPHRRRTPRCCRRRSLPRSASPPRDLWSWPASAI